MEVEQGARGLGQLEDQAATSRSRNISDYYNARGALETAGQQEGQDFSTQQANLQRAYAALAGKQGERAGQYGVLHGGALLQAAAKRAGNEGRESAANQTAHQRRVDELTRRMAQLDLTSAPPDEANPLGGREFQDLASHVSTAQSNQAFYEAGQHRLEGTEAAKAGYELPPSVVAALGGPAAVAALAPPKPAAPAAKASSKPPARKGPPARRAPDPFGRYRHGL